MLGSVDSILDLESRATIRNDRFPRALSHVDIPLVSTSTDSGLSAALTSAAWLESLEQAWVTARNFLSDERNSAEHWTGELSTSALSTATAISALSQVRKSQRGVVAARGSTEWMATQGSGLDSERRATIAASSDSESRATLDEAIVTGCQWLVQQQNEDGGFGDTNRSHSNIATTLLVLAAWELARQAIDGEAATANQAVNWRNDIERCQPAAWRYVEAQGKWEGLRRRYGKDKTFVVPIITNCALAGLVEWDQVPPLPFEAAWLPQEFYRWARMPVVSYAVPALVAIGQARFHFVPPRNPLMKALRSRAVRPTLKVLRSMQPSSGGYLEATPLTSFVLMSLAAVGNADLPVARDCLRFILGARLPDGSWPIDTNLATWVTSLAMNALSRRGKIDLSDAPALEKATQPGLVTVKTVRWLLSCQHRQRHPFTGANPGGWGWTDLSGAVPDADDTPAALLALSRIDWDQPAWLRLEQQALEGVGLGLNWLLRLQNRDGGWPTFCRGWGKLPFDRSGTDLTAHALRAMHAWLPHLERVNAAGGMGARRSQSLRASRIGSATRRGLAYLERTQRSDGSWLPLWFGNQDQPNDVNPIYGTGKVLLAYGSLELNRSLPAQRAMEYLQLQQNEDGGWGGGSSVEYARDRTKSTTKRLNGGQKLLSSPAQPPFGSHTSTIEETSIALEGLMCSGQSPYDASIMQALDWLAQTIQSGNLSCAWPIGFYFAKLWYHERLYPTLFSLSALGAALESAHPSPIAR